VVSNGSTELWFPIADLLPLVDHCVVAPGHAADPEHGTVPLLQLTAQGAALFYLSTNAVPALLVDAFDPSSMQRVHALGHSHHSSGTSYPAPEDRYGPPTLLGVLPVRTDRQELFATLLDQLGTAARHGRDWLVVTLDPAGHLDWYLHPTPHPAPAAEWRTVRLELFGLPGVWPGQIVTNDTHLGWLRPRFTRPVAEQLAAAITAATWLPHLVTPIQLTPDLTGDPADTSHNGIEVVGPDPDGFYRVGDGWHWASLDLLPNGILAPYTGPSSEQTRPRPVAPGVNHSPASRPTSPCGPPTMTRRVWMSGVA